LKSIFRDDDEGILADTFLDQRLKEIKLYWYGFLYITSNNNRFFWFNYHSLTFIG
jgi:hypothetical protein